jgi:hypothetical protein
MRTSDLAQREALLKHLEHVHGKAIGVNLAIHVGPKAIHLIALDISNGPQLALLLNAAERERHS